MNNHFIYSKHNDLIKNYLFLSSKIITYLEDYYSPNFSSSRPAFFDYKLTYRLNDEGMFIDKQWRKEYDAIEEIKKIHSILKNRYCHDSIFDENLLLSRFFYSNWRGMIKNMILKKLPQNSLNEIKNYIINVLNELEYRLGLDYTCNIDSIVEFGLWMQFPKYYTQEDIDFEKSVFEKNLDKHEYVHRDFNLVLIKDDIEWLKGLSKEDFNKTKIKLRNDFNKNNLVHLLNQTLKCKRYFNSEYKNSYKDEIIKFVEYITSSYEKPNFNLHFIDRNKLSLLNFSRIFLYLQHLDYITSNKGELEMLLADTFNRSTRYFQVVTKQIIEKELNTNMGVAYETLDYLKGLGFENKTYYT